MVVGRGLRNWKKPPPGAREARVEAGGRGVGVGVVSESEGGWLVKNGLGCVGKGNDDRGGTEVDEAGGEKREEAAEAVLLGMRGEDDEGGTEAHTERGGGPGERKEREENGSWEGVSMSEEEEEDRVIEEVVG